MSTATAYCYCLLSLLAAAAYCIFPLMVLNATAYCHCLLLLPLLMIADVNPMLSSLVPIVIAFSC